MERIKELAGTPVRLTEGVISAKDFDDLTIHIVFFRYTTKEERGRIIEPFLRTTERRHKEAVDQLEEFSPKLDKWTLITVKRGIQILELTLVMCHELLDVE
jgi:hypothetical protein